MDLVDAIHAIKLGKSPGVDGLPVEFYAALLDNSESHPKRHDPDVEVSHSSIIILLHKVCQEMTSIIHINEGDASICRPAQYNMLIGSMRRSIVRLRTVQKRESLG